jgi:hypothetical protein
MNAEKLNDNRQVTLCITIIQPLGISARSLDGNEDNVTVCHAAVHIVPRCCG